jgi:glycerophosphoryl diester phosphodiesterase
MEFAGRRTTKTIDGVDVTGWFTEDFTLSELKTLRTKERLPDVRPGNVAYDGRFDVPTLQEVIDLIKEMELEEGRRVGIYPETKHPSYFDSIGLSLEESLVDALHENGYRGKNAPVFVQSFETANLRELATLTQLPLIQLVNAGGQPWDFEASGDSRTYADLITATGLEEIAAYAAGIGANKDLIVPRDASNNLLEPTRLIEDAHAAGLIVHAWTFRSENEFLPNEFRLGDPGGPRFLSKHGDAAAEIARFLALGLDGFFTDFPDTGVRTRDAFVAR